MLCAWATQQEGKGKKSTGKNKRIPVKKMGENIERAWRKAKNPTQAMERLYDSVDRANIGIGGPNVERPLALCLYVFQLFCNILWSGKYHLTISTQPQLFFHPFFCSSPSFSSTFFIQRGIEGKSQPNKCTHTQIYTNTKENNEERREFSDERCVSVCCFTIVFRLYCFRVASWRTGDATHFVIHTIHRIDAKGNLPS